MSEQNFTPTIVPITNKLIENVAGKTFGRLTVLGYVGSNVYGKRGPVWLCRCDCGNTRILPVGSIKYGETQSCGCLHNELLAKKNAVIKKKHGMSTSPEYHSWNGMKARCCNPKCASWPRYGGRGITVCERWRKSFNDFLSDVGLRPGPEYSLNRIDNDGNYEPGNVEWSTAVEQSNNRSSNVFYEFNGESHTISEWSKIVGIHRETLFTRLNEHNWSIEKAFTTPVKSKCG